MKLLDRSTLVGAVGIVALGIAFGVISNLSAGNARRLEWSRDYPDPTPGKKHCPDVLPEPGTEPVETPIEETAPVGETAPVAPIPGPGLMTGAVGPSGSTAPAVTSTAPAGTSGTPATTGPSAPAPMPTAPAPTAPPASAVSIPPVPPGEPFLELSPQQVDYLFDQHALFIDARVTSQYVDGHVAGALPIAIWEAGVPEKIAATVFEVEGDKNRPVVVYCNGGDCEDSHNLARMFTEDGYTSMYVYKHGYPDWLDRGRPIRKGDAR